MFMCVCLLPSLHLAEMLRSEAEKSTSSDERKKKKNKEISLKRVVIFFQRELSSGLILFR